MPVSQALIASRAAWRASRWCPQAAACAVIVIEAGARRPIGIFEPLLLAGHLVEQQGRDVASSHPDSKAAGDPVRSDRAVGYRLGHLTNILKGGKQARTSVARPVKRERCPARDAETRKDHGEKDSRRTRRPSRLAIPGVVRDALAPQIGLPTLCRRRLGQFVQQ